MNTFRVELVVRQVVDGKTVAFYVSDDIELPFVPTVGTRFKYDDGDYLWATSTGELIPTVEAVTYDLDMKVHSCLFTVGESLISKFWSKIDNAEVSPYRAFFEPRTRT